MNEDSLIGQTINNYQIISVLGEGGMGKVYRAKHQHIGKQVAIKILKSEICSQTESVKRFYQEAKTVNDIGHENVVDIIDFGQTTSNDYYLIMELLDGYTLGKAIQAEAPFSARRLGAMTLQICSALEEAHKKGIVHRDLKPDNIFLINRAGSRDFVKILDFGLVKLLNDEEHSAKTTTGMVLGTPLYMAPEQALGRPLDAQTDIYALGVILYQMATNTLPFSDPNPVAVATMHVTKPLPPPRERNPNIDPALESVIVRCLAKEKHDRYTSMKAVAADIAAACKISTNSYQRDLIVAPIQASGMSMPMSTTQLAMADPASTPTGQNHIRTALFAAILSLVVGAVGLYSFWPNPAIPLAEQTTTKTTQTKSQTLPLSTTTSAVAAPQTAEAPASTPTTEESAVEPTTTDVAPLPTKSSVRPKPDKKKKSPKNLDDATLTPDFMKKKTK